MVLIAEDALEREELFEYSYNTQAKDADRETHPFTCHGDARQGLI